MPIYFDLLLSFAVGALFVPRLRHKPALLSGRFNFALLAHAAFQLVVLTPIQSYSFRFHHDWTVAYLIDPRAFPRFDAWLGIWSAIALLLTVGAGALGHYFGRIPVDRPKSPLHKRALIAVGTLFVLSTAVFFKEWLYVGTYEEFFEGSARLWFVTVVGWVGMIQLGLCFAFLRFGPDLLERVPDEILDV